MRTKLKTSRRDILENRLARLSAYLESMHIAEYVELLQNPKRLIVTNFIAGLARGLGIALGATLLVAVMLEGLRRIVILNIPGIGSFVAEIVRIVEMQNGRF